MIYWFRKTYIKIKRVLDYLPIIWNGYDYDYKYAIDLFAHQLGRIADFLESDKAYTACAKDKAKRIRTTLRLIQLVSEEEYAMEYLDYSDIEHRFIPKGSGDYYMVESNHISDNYDEFFKKYPLIHKRVLNGEGAYGKKYNKNNSPEDVLRKNVALNIAYLNQERATKILHKLIERNIQSWWD